MATVGLFSTGVRGDGLAMVIHEMGGVRRPVSLWLTRAEDSMASVVLLDDDPPVLNTCGDKCSADVSSTSQQ